MFNISSAIRAVHNNTNFISCLPFNSQALYVLISCNIWVNKGSTGCIFKKSKPCAVWNLIYCGTKEYIICHITNIARYILNVCGVYTRKNKVFAHIVIYKLALLCASFSSVALLP